MLAKHDLHSAQPLNMHGYTCNKSILDVSVPCKRENHSSALRGLLGNTGADFVEDSAYCLSNANRWIHC